MELAAAPKVPVIAIPDEVKEAEYKAVLLAAMVSTRLYQARQGRAFADLELRAAASTHGNGTPRAALRHAPCAEVP
jgi:hypothetical protein